MFFNINQLALTAFGESVEAECLAVGMEALYEKPITQTKLKEVLLKWLPGYLIK